MTEIFVESEFDFKSCLTVLVYGFHNRGILALFSFLALRFKNGSYILNGNWASNSPGTYNAVGTKFIYVKGNSNSGEFISSPGPTSHPLELLVRFAKPQFNIRQSS